MTSPPNLSLNPDPACIAFRSFSTSRFLGFAQRLGAGGARLASFVRPLMNLPALVGGTTPIWWCEFAPKTVEAWGGTCTLSKAVIGMALNEPGYYLFECTPDWRTVFDTWYESFDLALSAAVSEYPEATTNGIHRPNP